MCDALGRSHTLAFIPSIGVQAENGACAVQDAASGASHISMRTHLGSVLGPGAPRCMHGICGEDCFQGQPVHRQRQREGRGGEGRERERERERDWVEVRQPDKTLTDFRSSQTRQSGRSISRSLTVGYVLFAKLDSKSKSYATLCPWRVA